MKLSLIIGKASFSLFIGNVSSVRVIFISLVLTSVIHISSRGQRIVIIFWLSNIDFIFDVDFFLLVITFSTSWCKPSAYTIEFLSHDFCNFLNIISNRKLILLIEWTWLSGSRRLIGRSSFITKRTSLLITTVNVL